MFQTKAEMLETYGRLCEEHQTHINTVRTDTHPDRGPILERIATHLEKIRPHTTEDERTAARDAGHTRANARHREQRRAAAEFTRLNDELDRVYGRDTRHLAE